MAGQPGLEETRSLTKTGLSQVTLLYKDGTDQMRARQLPQRALGRRFAHVHALAQVDRRENRDSYQTVADAEVGGADWVDIVRRAHASEIVVALEDRRGLPVSQLLRCKIDGIQVIDYQTFCERETCRLDLDELRPSWLIFGSGFTRGIVTDLLKRSFDILVSSIFLLMTLPLTLIAALLIKLESPGPIQYRQ